jgi:hypothetical protein
MFHTLFAGHSSVGAAIRRRGRFGAALTDPMSSLFFLGEKGYEVFGGNKREHTHDCMSKCF